VKHPLRLVCSVLLFCAPACVATPLISTVIIRSVPTIPHGQDWGIVLPPQPAIPQFALSFDEVKSMLPALPPIGHDYQPREFGLLGHKQKQGYVLTAGCILIATILLLAGYDLIPRAHAGTLRLRSMHLKQDLLG